MTARKLPLKNIAVCSESLLNTVHFYNAGLNIGIRSLFIIDPYCITMLKLTSVINFRFTTYSIAV